MPCSKPRKYVAKIGVMVISGDTTLQACGGGGGGGGVVWCGGGADTAIDEGDAEARGALPRIVVVAAALPQRKGHGCMVCAGTF